MKSTGIWGSVLVGVGLAAVFVAQQVLVPGGVRTAFLAVGALALLAALLLRVFERGRAVAAARTVETWLAVATGGVVLSMALYGATTDAGLAALGLGRSDGLGGASLALALVFLTSINYVASQRDVVRDLSYFKTTAPSDASLRLVRQLGEKVEAVLFYPEVNEVRDQVVPYFEALAAAGPELEVGVRDHALAPELAREHRVRGNGFVLLLRGEGEHLVLGGLCEVTVTTL